LRRITVIFFTRIFFSARFFMLTFFTPRIHYYFFFIVKTCLPPFVSTTVNERWFWIWSKFIFKTWEVCFKTKARLEGLLFQSLAMLLNTEISFMFNVRTAYVIFGHTAVRCQFECTCATPHFVVGREVPAN